MVLARTSKDNPWKKKDNNVAEETVTDDIEELLKKALGVALSRQYMLPEAREAFVQSQKKIYEGRMEVLKIWDEGPILFAYKLADDKRIFFSVQVTSNPMEFETTGDVIDDVGEAPIYYSVATFFDVAAEEWGEIGRKISFDVVFLRNVEVLDENSYGNNVIVGHDFPLFCSDDDQD